MKRKNLTENGRWMVDGDGRKSSGVVHPRSSGGVLALLAALLAASALANPIGMTVTRGTATTSQTGSQLNIKVSRGAVLDWRSFNIKPGETTTFIQPSSTSVVWNRILDPNLSQVWGNLNANGWVVLMNQNGFYFGPNSVVKVGGLMVTTAPVASESPAGGGLWQFSGTPPLASIVNYGEIKAQSGGSVFLISEKVENHGTISAPAGTVGLYAGKEVLISERPDGRGLSAKVKLPAGSVDNSGNIIADAGTIALHAQVVNQNGLLQANAVRQRNGVIELVATEDLHLGADSVLQAKGDATGVSSGGSIVVKSGQTFSDAAGSRIDVSGGAQGGNGGSVEISAPRMSSIQSHIDGGAKAGWKGGSLFFDPTDIFLTSDGTDSAGSGTVLSGDSPDTLRLNVNSAFAGFSQIRLEATRDITIDPYTSWNLNDSTGISAPGSLLTLEAGRNLVFGDNSRITGGAGWSIRLAAGVDFSSPTHSVRNGIGSVYLNGGPPDDTGTRPAGGGALETADGSISLEAGHEIVVGAGFIRTVGGGNIDIKTGDGDVDAGSNPNGYKFFTSRLGSGYDISDAGLGGIGTAHGGNVTINSGHDILSFIPTVGAYGAGDVTLTAADRILGKFIVRDGHGVLQAGTDVGSGSSTLSLSLIRGGWDVTAAGNVYLNEVLNPNGVFNSLPVARVRYRFDYAPDAFVHLTGQSVQLLGNALAADQQGGNRDRPAIYPPQLDIHAGAGGVVLGNDLVLYPSSQGKLHITTTGGGSLISSPGHYYQLIMSDSGSTDYKSFASGHAPVPLHLGDLDPVSLIVDGDLQNVFLRSPTHADILVYGNALNFSFEGQNLSVNDGKDNASRKPFADTPVNDPNGNYSGIWIKGDYFSRSDRTFAVLSDKPSDLDSAFKLIFTNPLYLANPDLAAKLTYNPATHTLGFQGRMTANDKEFLLHPYILSLDQYNMPRFDANGLPITVPVTFTKDTAAINKLDADSQDIPSSSLAYNGLQIGGPGRLTISARNFDLGTSHGIRSVGTLLNSSLEPILYPDLAAPLAGASLTLDLAGDLRMISSQIASFNSGNINVTATHGGTLNIGSQEQFSSDDTPKGIYTAHGGDVTVTADGKIDINGSRIATYDGGNVSVTSKTDDVDAGGGARGSFTVSTQQRNPLTGALELRNDKFFGSGIVALTRPDSQSTVGNITVTAGRDILASAGGVLQLAFNKTDISHALVKLDAGRDIVANQSGVLGANIDLTAGRNVLGLVVGSGNVNLTAVGNITASVLGGGNVSVSGASLTGSSFVGGGEVNVSGSGTAIVVATQGSANASGVTAVGGAIASAPAPVAQQTTTEADKAAVTAKNEEETEDQKKQRLKAAPVLVKTVGRVTVILPNKQ